MREPNLLAHRDESQLLSILEAAAGVPVVGVSREVTLDVAGGNTGGKPQLTTFFYTTQDGSAGEVTLFVKRCTWKRRSEAVHYRHLTTHGVPTPRLYGVLRNQSDEEIIFLEPLTATDFRSDSEEEWRRMLSLLARFNA